MPFQKIKRIYFFALLFFIGAATMFLLQYSWLQAHKPQFYAIRLAAAPAAAGLFFCLLGRLASRFNRFAELFEASLFMRRIRRIFAAGAGGGAREYILVSLLLLLLILASFANVFFFGRTLRTSATCPGAMPSGPYRCETFVGSRPALDTGASAWAYEPWAAKVRRLFSQGQAPLWNPNSGVGAPLLANMQSAPFSPFRLILHLLPFQYGWEIYFALRLLAAGFFTYLCLRMWNHSAVASFASAVIFMFCGYNILYINMGHLDVDVLAPACIFAFECLFRNPRPIRIAFGSLLVCFTILGGMPESAFFVLMLSSAYYAFRTFSTRPSAPGAGLYFLKKFLPVSSAILLGFLLSGPQLFPFLEYLKNSWTNHVSDVGAASNPLTGGISLAIPYFFGKIFNGWNDIHPFALGSYVGAIPLLLAIFAIFSRKDEFDKKLAYFCALFCLFFLCKYFGFFFINWIGRLPVFDKAIFAKYCLPEFSFCVAVLAGLGVDALIQKRLHLRSLAIGTSCLLGFAAIYLLLKPMQLFPELAEARTLRYVLWHISIFLFFALSAFLLARLSLKKCPSLPLLLLILLAAAELIHYIPGERPVRCDAAAAPPYVSFLHSDPESFRVLGIDNVLYPNSSSYFNLDSVANLDAMYPRRYLTFIRSLLSPQASDRFVGSELTLPLEDAVPVLSLMNVKYVLTPESPFDLTSELLKTAEAAGKSRFEIDWSQFTIGDRTRTVLFQRPPSSLVYPVKIGPRPALSFAIALSPDCWSPDKGDGVLFKIKVRSGGAERDLFSASIDPKNALADRKWSEHFIDLSPVANREVELVFETHPLKNNAFDSAGWVNMELFQDASSRNFELVYDREIKIYRNNQYFPRAYIVPRALCAKNGEESLRWLRSALPDLKQKAILENAADCSPNPAPATDGRSEAKILHYGAREVEIETTSSDDGFLVLSDMHYPGWKAYVDGKEERILCANYLFRALPLESGSHRVRFVYAPISFNLGLLSGILALAFLGLYAVLKR